MTLKGWEEEKRKHAGEDGKGKELFFFPSTPRVCYFSIITNFIGIPIGFFRLCLQKEHMLLAVHVYF